MADIKFGAEQINNPTPSRINLWVRVITVVASTFLAWMTTSNTMGPNTKELLTGIISLVLGLCNGLAPLFGVEVPPRVSSDKVTAIDK